MWHTRLAALTVVFWLTLSTQSFAQCGGSCGLCDPGYVRATDGVSCIPGDRLAVRSCAGTTCSQCGAACGGNTGTVVDGPYDDGTFIWWKIRWDHDIDCTSDTGWSAERPRSNCALAAGACCISNSCYTGYTQTTCQNQGGAWKGEESTSCTNCAPQCVPPDCNDNNPCTTDGPCINGVCQRTNNTNACSDNNACTNNDRCSNGFCTGTPITCNDGKTCTDDSCNPSSGCVYVNNTNSCDDNNACTNNDRCSNGSCTATAITCNDNKACTDDSCNPSSGCVYVNNTNSCDDNNACTNNDRCSNGTCTGTTNPGCTQCTTDSQCNDNKDCTDNRCSSGQCQYPNNTAVCDDNNSCTNNDRCSNGTCTGTTIPGCTQCTTDNQCNDNKDCTDNRCISGQCQYSNNTAVCDDNNSCTNNDRCSNGVCSGTNSCDCTPATALDDCDDDNVCTTDTCVNNTCRNTQITGCPTDSECGDLRQNGERCEPIPAVDRTRYLVQASLVYLNPSNEAKPVCTEGTGCGAWECCQARAIADKTADRLYDRGYSVIVDYDQYNAGERANQEASQPIVFVAIHSNALEGGCFGTNTGPEVWWQNASQGDESLAKSVFDSLKADFQRNGYTIALNRYGDGTPSWTLDRPINRQEYPNWHKATMAACVVETLFHDNVADARLLCDEGWQEVLADAIASGIDDYLLETDDPVATVPVPPEEEAVPCGVAMIQPIAMVIVGLLCLRFAPRSRARSGRDWLGNSRKIRGSRVVQP